VKANYGMRKWYVYYCNINDIPVPHSTEWLSGRGHTHPLMDWLINKILMRARCLAGKSGARPVKSGRLIRHEFASRINLVTANPCTLFSRIYISHGDMLNEVTSVVSHLHPINHS